MIQTLDGIEGDLGTFLVDPKIYVIEFGPDLSTITNKELNNF
jgi:hypothetical protein